jgi:proline racemase
MRVSNLITAIDLHACGEPGCVITGGVLDVPGRTMFEKARYLATEGDDLRKRMLREPRGYPASNCNLALPPTHPEADAGFIIMEQVEYLPMSGTNTICVATALIETGIVPVTEPVTKLTLEAPAGLIRVEAKVAGGKVRSVTFENVPAFALHWDTPIEVPELGSIVVDVAFSVMFYVIADAEPFGLRLTPDEARDIMRIGEMGKKAASAQLKAVLPDNPEISGVTIAEFVGPPFHPDATAKHVVVVSTGSLAWNHPASSWTGAVDHSPCSTGTCARMTPLHAKDRLSLHEDFVHEDILGTIFTGRLIEETTVGELPAVVPQLTGSAWITGFAHYVLDPEDPFPTGFTVGDIWERGGDA